MKRRLFTFALTVLTVGLLGSCSKINERLDNLEKKVDGIENEQIASINTQITNINSSIADLGQIRSDISNLKQTAEAHGEDIFALQEADETLGNRIDNLEDYLDVTLPTFAEKDWVIATFSTLEQYEATCDTIAKIEAKLGTTSEKLSKDIKACADSLTKWINVKFSGYYTAAEMDAKLAQMKSAIDSAKSAGGITDAKADSIAAELTKTKAAVDTAKANIRKEYRAAIDTAIKTSEGKLTKALQEKITEVNGKIESLTTRVGNLETSVSALKGKVEALEGMIQSVTIVPAYSDGSVKVDDKDSLYIGFIVSPASAVANLAAGNVAILVNKVKTKAFAGVDSIKIGEGDLFEKDATKGTVSVRVSVAGKIPAADSTITVAVNVKNGVSNYTTEFVPVTLPVSVSLDKHLIVVQSPDSDKDTTLTATVKNAKDINVTWTSSNTGIATVDNAGKVTIKADAIGKDTIVVTTVEGAKTDTCFVTVLPEGALAGEFTVNADGKKVHFSQGNLWYGKVGEATTATWNFETNQYDSTPVSSDNWDDSHVSHFFWSKDASKACYDVYTSSEASGSDVFFTNATTETAKADFTVNGVTGKYRTLSTAEWQYLINTNNDENIRKGKYKYGVKVCDKENCLILVPDECLNGYSFDNTKTSYSTEEWATAEAAGLVCLPAAGSRNSSSVSYVGVSGCCWLSSANGEDDAYRVYFNSGDVYPESSGRGSGYSVRLITECQ